MCRGSAVDPVSTPGPGPFAACHSPSLTPFPVTLFSCTINKARKGQKQYLKKKKISCQAKQCLFNSLGDFGAFRYQRCWFFLLFLFQLTWREHCRCSISQGILSAAREVRDFPHKYPIVGAELELLHQLFSFRQLQVFHCDRPLQLTQFIGEIFNFFLV